MFKYMAVTVIKCLNAGNDDILNFLTANFSRLVEVMLQLSMRNLITDGGILFLSKTLPPHDGKVCFSRFIVPSRRLNRCPGRHTPGIP